MTTLSPSALVYVHADTLRVAINFSLAAGLAYMCVLESHLLEGLITFIAMSNISRDFNIWATVASEPGFFTFSYSMPELPPVITLT